MAEKCAYCGKPTYDVKWKYCVECRKDIRAGISHESRIKEEGLKPTRHTENYGRKGGYMPKSDGDDYGEESGL